ncbi:MAG: hypothetical protein ACFFCP_11390 [Promethearchaeota archaeon]
MASKNLAFASMLSPGKEAEYNTLLFVESIREFAGDFANVPIWCYFPGSDSQISSKLKERLLALDVQLLPFHIVDTFPFLANAQAASMAEKRARGEFDILAWLASNTVFLQEPSEYRLKDGKMLGYRPVHHALIGSRYNEPLDEFWTKIYEYCQVPKERIFPMNPHIEETQIRPYFNSGSLVSRPEKGLFGNWFESFLEQYQLPEFREYYKRDGRYAIFIHQSILSGIILSKFTHEEIIEFPPSYNYPVHLFAEDNTKYRPQRIDQLVTFRHEGFHMDPDWEDRLPAGPELTHWLKEKLSLV